MKTNHPDYEEPDNFEYNLRLIVRRTLACLLMVAAYFAGTGCRSPLIEVNRNAPLINVQDSANGNTVPLVGGQ